MTVLDAADLVVIAARTLGIGSDAALASMDVKAAQAALAEAGQPGPARGRRCRAVPLPLPLRRGWNSSTRCCGTIRSRGRTSRSRSRPGCSSSRSTGGGLI